MGEWYETPLARTILEDMRAKAQKRLGMKAWLERQAEWDARNARYEEIVREQAEERTRAAEDRTE
jgi:hypothetical protein